MKNYAPQMDAARRGIITSEMKAVAQKEYRTAEEIREFVAKEQVVICANKLHTCIDPNGVGSMLRTKINVNPSVSRDCKGYDIEMQKIMAAVNMGAPFYVLGPIITVIAPGYDHITSAIGNTIAAASGAGFLCYVTPAEHLALPNVEDVKQSIITSHIAAHAADIAKKVPHARDPDDQMADARRTFDWEKPCSIDPETAKSIRDSRAPEHEDICSTYGKFCTVRSMNRALSGEYIDIL